MEPVLGIDLGTTNSVVSIVRDGKPEVLRDEQGRTFLPSIVGVDGDGELLTGEQARNQLLVAPERTVRSIKRKMGEDVKVAMGDREFSPQEISAMILRTLADRAEAACGKRLTKAVITVPAFFNDGQREATREAGSLAGLEVVRIINEPTAASLVYEPHSDKNEKLLVYDLGGGTFDVSVVQIEQGVIEVLSSHGDTHLGGDDFDELLLDRVADAFKAEHGVDLRDIPTARSRLLQSVEDAKKRLSQEPFAAVAEEFIAEQDGRPLNLNVTIERIDYEQLIAPLLQKTLSCVDAALDDAKLTAPQIDRVVLVGGSTRTPLVHRMLQEQLQHSPRQEIDPDLCVSLGAAVQGALVAGLDVGPVLVDITPHTLGIQCLGELFGMSSAECFSPIIPRNTPLPATRSEIYYTAQPGQKAAEIHVLQGENEVARFNDSVGRFMLRGLNDRADAGNELLVRFDLNLDGILKVTAQERSTGLREEITIDNPIARFRAGSRQEATARLAEMFGAAPQPDTSDPQADDSQDDRFENARQTLAKARQLSADAPADDAAEMEKLADRLAAAIRDSDGNAADSIGEQLDDLLFYLHDA